MGAGNKFLVSHALLRSLLVGWALELMLALRLSASGWRDSLYPPCTEGRSAGTKIAQNTCWRLAYSRSSCSWRVSALAIGFTG